MKTEEVKHIDLNLDLTQTDLMNLLNRKMGGKKFSTKKGKMSLFTAQDVQGYVERGQLPDKYGGNKIKVIKNPGSALVLLRITNIQDIHDMPDFKEKKK